MKIALSTDHAGYELLKQLKVWLGEQGHECIDFGPVVYDENDDYPDFIIPAAQSVAKGECEAGIIMGGSGEGEAMAANRVKGVRCVVYYGPATPTGSIDAEGNMPKDEFEILRLSREHNNANMLSLASRFIEQPEIEHAVKTWLETPFVGVERHTRRIAKIDSLS